MIRHHIACTFAPMCLALAALGCSAAPPPDDCVVVGLLASYTGDQAADGFNIERAMQLATNSVNAGTRVASKRLCLVYGDTHSSPTRGLETANAMLDRYHPLVLIGPDDLDLARDVQPILEAHGTFNILPGITSSQVVRTSAHLSVELGPPADAMGCSIAQSVYDLGARSVAVVYGPSILSVTLANSLAQRMASYARPMSPAKVTLFRVEEDLNTYGSLTTKVAETSPDSVVLLVSTTTAATLAAEWLPTQKLHPTFMLGPGLLNEVLLTNVPPGFLDGAYGVSPSTSNRADEDALAREYHSVFGEEIFPISNFYYDSMAVTALAIEAASIAAGGQIPNSQQVSAQLRYVTTSPGKRVNWNELGSGLELLTAKSDIDYYGISGPLTMDASGAFDTSSSVFAYHRVSGDQIAFSNVDTCSAF